LSYRTGICLVASLLVSGIPGSAQEARSADDNGNAVGKVFQDCGECPSMVVVPPGRFMMGSPAEEQGRDDDEGPLHDVRIAKFAVGRFEVTFAEWDACVRDGGCGGYTPQDKGWGRGDRPVMNVSWDRAKSYVSWLALKTGKPYRLLTEAEWEYAARAGADAPFATGRTINVKQAQFGGASGHADQTVPVGSFTPNAFGLHDMHGNIWEWVEDCWHDDYENAPADGAAWLEANEGACGYRIYRGGSWFNIQSVVRSANRTGSPPDFTISNIGFRVAKTLEP
jgi:formylglycine-generating enzyme required for sulfatase activity